MDAFIEPIFVAYAAIVFMASICVYWGCHQSTEGNFKLSDEFVVCLFVFRLSLFFSLSLSHFVFTYSETMNTKDAYMFPVYGSGVLFGLYLLFKFFSKRYINYLLTAYFLFFGLTTLAGTLIPFVHFLTRAPRSQHLKMELRWLGSVDFKWGAAEVIAALIAAGVCAAYAATKHWIVSNILGVAFSVQGIALLSIGSYWVGCVLLGGLFIYDIFWVFGTDVMVTVAKSFDAPIKLVFPRNIFTSGAYEFTMLGLGDIVLPGVFLALLLRYDRSRFQARKSQDTPFFTWSFVSYVAGLLATIGVMHFFKAAQPALLYLVPACVGTSWLVGIVTGELGALFAYKDPSEEDTKKKKKTSNSKKEEKVVAAVGSVEDKKKNKKNNTAATK